jgi:ADP-heptose:LPS heptosyltransferase
VASGPRRISRVERNLELVRALGIECATLPAVDLPIAAAAAPAADRLLAGLGLRGAAFAIVNPGASRSQAHKRPPAALLGAASCRLAARGVAPLVVWGPGEEADAAAVLAAAGGRAHLAPRTDLGVLSALLARARVFVGGDTGPLHLACAAGCPVLGIYGPTDPAVNAPWGVPHRALSPPGRHYTGVKRHDRRRGFEGLAADTVEAAVDDLLREGLAARA